MAANFHTKLSYWWANILFIRFSINPDDILDTVYDPQNNVFAISINNTIYDARGIVKEPNNYVIWKDYIATQDDIEINEILRKHVYFYSPAEWDEFCKTVAQLNNNQ